MLCGDGYRLGLPDGTPRRTSEEALSLTCRTITAIPLLTFGEVGQRFRPIAQPQPFPRQATHVRREGVFIGQQIGNGAGDPIACRWLVGVGRTSQGLSRI